MERKTVDLHMHSYFSDDGEFSPIELVEKCKAAGIKYMAITDHNCTRANIQGQKAALEAGITYIPAIEIDCIQDGVNLHVLGYGIDYLSEDFAKIEENIQEQSIAVSLLTLLKTQELGFSITKEEMEEVSQKRYWKNSWAGDLFAEVLLSNSKYKEHPILKPYRLGGERGDNPFVNFYWDYYSQGKPCYVETKYPGLSQIIEAIHKNGGVAVLAHPGMNLKNNETLLDVIVQVGIDGIEAFSSYHTPEQCSHYYQKAVDNKLFVTCGSDYHGLIKPAISLGQHGCQISDECILEQLGRLASFFLN